MDVSGMSNQHKHTDKTCSDLEVTRTKMSNEDLSLLRESASKFTFKSFLRDDFAASNHLFQLGDSKEI